MGVTTAMMVVAMIAMAMVAVAMAGVIMRAGVSAAVASRRRVVPHAHPALGRHNRRGGPTLAAAP